MDFDILFDARGYLSVKSHTPGKLTLKVNPAIMADPKFKNIQKPGSLPRGVTNVKTSIFPPSVTIDYQADIVPFDTLDELFATDDPERGRALLAELSQHLGLA